MGKDLKEQAIEAWSELAFRNAKTDSQVNDLLEYVAGNKYLTSDDSEDPIWDTICRLNDGELELFMIGCNEIDKADAA